MGKFKVESVVVVVVDMNFNLKGKIIVYDDRVGFEIESEYIYVNGLGSVD